MRRVLFIGLVSLVAQQASAALTLLDKDGWTASLGGFVELDAIYDTTRSFVEAQGNAPVSNDAVDGQCGREQFSVRNSRLSLDLEAPEKDGWKARGYYEMDFLGFDPEPTVSSTGAPDTEAAFFNSPTMRVRHAFLSAEKDGWQLLGGQYWQVFGWQPYYFIPSIQVAPIAGMLYGRTAQARVTKTFGLANDEQSMQLVLGVMRPPQRDASMPGFEAGWRYVWRERVGGFTGGATGARSVQPMSIGVTGLVREIAIPASPATPTGELSRFPATAVAVDVLVPVIGSPDRHDPGDTLVVGGEFTTGRGYGDQFAGWTGNTASTLASGSQASVLEKGVSLDGGIGDFDTQGNFQLIDLRTFNAYFQYHLPPPSHTWLSGGYGRIYSDNVGLLTTGVNAPAGASPDRTGAGNIPYNRDEVYFANVMHDLTAVFRVGFEFAHTRTTYQDGYLANNNRYQLSVWFLF